MKRSAGRIRLRNSAREVSSSSGASLVEVAIVTTILTVTLSWMVTIVVSASSARQDAQLRLEASRLAEHVVAQLRSLSMATLLNTYGKSDGQSGSPWTGVTDQDNMSVTIQVFTDESQSNPAAGMPRDLDGDEAISSADVAQDGDGDGEPDYAQLAGVVLVEWRGGRGHTQELRVPIVAKNQ